MNNPSGWSLIDTAPDQLTAEMWVDILQKQGVPAMVLPGDARSFLGLSSFPCPVMVPKGMEEEGKSILEGLQEPDN